MKVIKFIIVFVLILLSPFAWNQMHYGSIEYEVTINMDKRFPPNKNNFRGGNIRKNFNTSSNNYLKEKAVLYFNDTMSVFVTEPLENMRDLNRTFLTNTVVNTNSNIVETHVNLMGEEFLIKDNLPKREWKFTNKERQIAGKMAKQAITQINDSTTVYAWFDTDVFPSIGPESYWDLPGAILGLAYEDGSITYFATKISGDFVNLKDVQTEFKSRKTFTRNEFEAEFLRKYDANNRLYRLIKDLLHFY